MRRSSTVFINKAYEVLRAHPDLKGTKLRRSQLVVSTHSSHVAHEVSYECYATSGACPRHGVADTSLHGD